MKNNRFTKNFLAAVTVAGLIISATAAHADLIYTWTGAVDGDWENAANWDANGIPVDTDPGNADQLDQRTTDNDIIIQGTAPTLNIPTFSGGDAFNNNNANTPQIQMQSGTMSVDVDTWRGQGVVHNPNSLWSSSVGTSGGNGSAVLYYNVISGPDGRGYNRDPDGPMKWTIYADGTLNISSPRDTFTMSFNSSRTVDFHLPGGTLHFVDSALNLGGYEDNFFDLTAPGASVTVNFGGDFDDLAAVNTAIADEIHFISSTEQELEAVDNEDGTFTVSVPVPPAGTVIMFE